MADPAPFHRRWSPRMRRAAGATLVCAALTLGGCVGNRDDVTGSINAGAPRAGVDARTAAADWGEKYRANPGDKAVALNYARALKATTQYQQAEAVLEGAAIKAPYDPDVLGAYGKALADSGKFKEASEVLARAQRPDSPNWNILSAQGAVADQMGNHAEAQNDYLTALKIKPNDPSVLTNLGLSYALSNNLPLAEATIRQAAQMPGADMRVRQNLALVLALEGKFGEAEQVAQTDLSPADATANIAQIRAMISQSDTWRNIQRAGARSAPGRRPERLQAALQTN